MSVILVGGRNFRASFVEKKFLVEIIWSKQKFNPIWPFHSPFCYPQQDLLDEEAFKVVCRYCPYVREFDCSAGYIFTKHRKAWPLLEEISLLFVESCKLASWSDCSDAEERAVNDGLVCMLVRDKFELASHMHISSEAH